MSAGCSTCPRCCARWACRPARASWWPAARTRAKKSSWPSCSSGCASVTGKTIKEEDYAKYSRIALICTLGAAFFITLFVNDVIGYISTIVGAFLPGVAVAMLLGRFWKRVNWQGGLACIGSGTLLGVLILVLPSFKNWINATMGGPAVPATIISLVFGIVVSLMFPADTTPDDVRLKHVMDDRRGTVVEKVAAAEAAAEEEEDL